MSPNSYDVCRKFICTSSFRIEIFDLKFQLLESLKYYSFALKVNVTLEGLIFCQMSTSIPLYNDSFSLLYRVKIVKDLLQLQNKKKENIENHCIL